VKNLLLLSDFNPNQNMPTKFRKDLKYVIPQKTFLWRVVLFYPEGRMDIVFGKCFAKGA